MASLRRSGFVRADHVLGPDVPVEVLGRQVAERERRLPQVVPSLCAFLAISAALS